MSRGRLIFPKLAVVARYDPRATAATGGFDEGLGELRVVSPNDGNGGRSTPREENLVQFRVQIETSSFLNMAQGPLGDAAGGLLRVVGFGPELEEAGLVEAETWRSLLKPTDRLDRILELDGTLIYALPNKNPTTGADEGGWYATQVQPCGFGFGGGANNLLELTFERRPTSVPFGAAG